MTRRISLLVASGFALLLVLGLLVSVIMMGGLKQTVLRSQASQTSALEVRAAVRSLRADYLQGGDALSRLLLDPTLADARAAKAEADANAGKHLASAEAATGWPALRAALRRLRAHDEHVTDRIENRLVTLAAIDPARARRTYFRRYLPARERNMVLVEEALRMASDEVAVAARLTETEAAKTLLFAWVTLGLFLTVGTLGGAVLSRVVQTIAIRFEKAAAEVAEQRDHLEAIMTAMRDALIVVDAAGVITLVNEATCELLGIDRSRLVGRPITRFLDPRQVARRGPDGTPGIDVVTYRARDGSEIPLAVSTADLRDARGAVDGAVWVAHDLREHFRMLAEVAAARDAALEGSRIKSEFLANVSHEIRTPMNVIIGYTDLVLDSGPSETHREYLARVRSSTVALLEIINDVLDISKVEAGKLSIEHVPFALRAVVEDVVQTFMLRADEKSLVLSLTIEPGVPGRVRGDPTRLRQVVLNLVSNAIKFTERGRVDVRVAREAAPGRGGAVVRLSVADTGIGIPADKQDVIFQAFTQADGSMSRRFGGTGLGLTIAARLVELMGGRIWVESAVGVGTVFHVVLELEVDREGLAA